MSRFEQIDDELRKVCKNCQIKLVTGCKGYPEEECKDFDEIVESITILRKTNEKMRERVSIVKSR
ncbi:hypothetical protein KAT92_06190 [Candidatus Babeliales bacterium]|nr:hypothetical protein [Candidatus Babeliales bacterium]